MPRPGTGPHPVLVKLDCARAYLGRLQAEPRFSDDFAPCLAALARHVDTAATPVARLGA